MEIRTDSEGRNTSLGVRLAMLFSEKSWWYFWV